MASTSVSSPLSQQADLALQEAIRIAQESNDHVCLQHCLVKRRLSAAALFFMCRRVTDPVCLCHQSWLYTLEQMRGSDSTVLTEDSVKMAAHFCLPVSTFQRLFVTSPLSGSIQHLS